MTIHLSATVVLQHLLFLFLLIVAPLWDVRYMSRLKREPSSPHKIGVYKTLCSWLWITSAVACVTVGFRSLFIINLAPGEIAWLQVPWVHVVVVIVIALFVTAGVLPFLLV